MKHLSTIIRRSGRLNKKVRLSSAHMDSIEGHVGHQAQKSYMIGSQ